MNSNVVPLPLGGKGGTFVAYIDRADFAKVSKFKWRVSERKSKNKFRYYVVRSEYYRDPETNEPRERTVYLHRFIMDAPPHLMVDHDNHDTLNNTRANLRLATRSQNAANTFPTKRSPYGRGVIKHTTSETNPYRAAITWTDHTTGKKNRVHLGHFKTSHEAALAYDIAAIKYFGSFAILNYPSLPGSKTVNNSIQLPMAAE